MSARQVDIIVEVHYVPMDEVQAAAWRASILLLLEFLREEICDGRDGQDPL